MGRRGERRGERAREREREIDIERTGYEPLDLDAPIQWAKEGYVIKNRGWLKGGSNLLDHEDLPKTSSFTSGRRGPHFPKHNPSLPTWLLLPKWLKPRPESGLDWVRQEPQNGQGGSNLLDHEDLLHRHLFRA